jgi:hypothetical protein
MLTFATLKAAVTEESLLTGINIMLERDGNLNYTELEESSSTGLRSWIESRLEMSTSYGN